jgi:hypothetical protein
MVFTPKSAFRNPNLKRRGVEVSEVQSSKLEVNKSKFEKGGNKD